MKILLLLSLLFIDCIAGCSSYVAPSAPATLGSQTSVITLVPSTAPSFAELGQAMQDCKDYWINGQCDKILNALATVSPEYAGLICAEIKSAVCDQIKAKWHSYEEAEAAKQRAFETQLITDVASRLNAQ